MAQNISLWNATYSDVPAVNLPKSGGGTARFTDASVTTAVESDVASGKIFIKADGTQSTGTASGGGTPAISVVDTTDSAGGTIRTITALDISDTTAVASDVASGKYFYTANGTKTAGTASGGGGNDFIITVSKDGSNNLIIDKTYSEVATAYNNGKNIAVTGDGSNYFTGSFWFDDDEQCFFINAYSSTGDDVALIYQEDGYWFYPNESYPDQTLTFYEPHNMNALPSDVISGKRFVNRSGYQVGTASSATHHVIHLEFTDSTDTDIDVYYDNSLIGTMITAYEPTTYGQKTVDSAELDGVEWYTRPTETWETVYDDVQTPNSDTPYNYLWISSLSDVYPIEGEEWRVTVDGTVYYTTATQQNAMGVTAVIIGNPKYSGGQDDGSSIPLNLYNLNYGALMGDTELTTVAHTIKLERKVTA